MATQRRLQVVFSCLLTVLLVSGAAMPSPALWQCRHAVRVVDAAFAGTSSAMPCRMGGRMPEMACCMPERPVALTSASAQQRLACPACLPTLTRLAALPAAGASETHVHLRRSLASMQAVLPLPTAFLPSSPMPLSLRQRPPPTMALPLSMPERTPGLRAPPLSHLL